MPQCLIVILHNTTNLTELLDTWQQIGVPGVTMFEGVGGYRANQRLKKAGLRSSLKHLFKIDELHSKTLIAVIDDDDLFGPVVLREDGADALGELFLPVVGGDNDAYARHAQPSPRTRKLTARVR